MVRRFRSSRFVVALVVLAVLGLVACRDGSDAGGVTPEVSGVYFSSLTVCQELLGICGSDDFYTLMMCYTNAERACDAQLYFFCLIESATCDEAAGVATADWAACAATAQCGSGGEIVEFPDDEGEDGSADNVEACETWLSGMDCGSFDYSTMVDCDSYADLDCDVAGYFDCLTDVTTCDEELGVPDTSGWASCTCD